jgi:hypothetical protein
MSEESKHSTDEEVRALIERFPQLDAIEEQDFDQQIASFSEVLRILEQDLKQHRG